MPVSQNTLSLILQATRKVQNSSDKNIGPLSRVIPDIVDAIQVEVVLPAGATGVSVPFPPGSTAVQGIIIITATGIFVHVNNGAAIPCGSWWVLPDTSITSLALDNQSSTATTRVEVWLVTTQ